MIDVEGNETRSNHNLLGQATFVYTPAPSGQSGEVHTEGRYDGFGRLKSFIKPEGETTAHDYDLPSFGPTRAGSYCYWISMYSRRNAQSR
jgi:hypothetical protein